MNYWHTPVMLSEVLEFLRPRAGQNFIDCTLGGGGYVIEIAKNILPGGRVMAIDLDEAAIKNAESFIGELKLTNIILVHDNFNNLREIVKNNWPDRQNHKFAGIVFDLGLSSAQLGDSSRGFSFQTDAPLNMSFGRGRSAGSVKRTAERYFNASYIVNRWPRSKLEEIIKKYGEERYAGRISEAIVGARRSVPLRSAGPSAKKFFGGIKTAGELAEIITRAVPAHYRHKKKIHPATRTFQALRIAVNRELENLEAALPQALDILAAGGRLIVISYHSLEDKIAKHFFRRESRDCLCPPDFPVCRCGHRAKLKIITKRVIKPGVEEIIRNSRARSARMRVGEKITNSE